MSARSRSAAREVTILFVPPPKKPCRGLENNIDLLAGTDNKHPNPFGEAQIYPVSQQLAKQRVRSRMEESLRAAANGPYPSCALLVGFPCCHDHRPS